MQSDVKGIIVLTQDTDLITVVLRGTGHITEVMAQATATAQDMPLTQAPSRWRLAIGRITLAVLVITWAAPITSGGLDIGHGAAVKEAGFTAITF